MSWCRHRSAPYRYTNRTVYGTVERLVCDCGETLSLGPAHDTPAALMELRAAELAQAVRDERTQPGAPTGVFWTMEENAGWIAHKHGRTSLFGCEAGWLARDIWTDEEDDRD